MSEKIPFELPLTFLDEYWLGYFRADGSLSSTKKARFAQKYEHPVKEFQAFIGGAGAISLTDRETNFGRNVMHTVTSAYTDIGPRLEALGVKTILHEPLYSSKHFWRGMMDGDGHLSWMPVKMLSYPRLMICGSETDMRKFSDWCGKIFQSKKPLPYQNKRSNIYYVGLGASKAQFLSKYLYEDEYSALPYKAIIALEFQQWEPRTAVNWQPPMVVPS